MITLSVADVLLGLIITKIDGGDLRNNKEGSAESVGQNIYGLLR